MRTMVIDIETIPLPDKEWDFTPATGRIVCIGLVIKGDDLVEQHFTITRQDEGELLSIFLEYLNTVGPDRVITYNGTRFDLPFIEGRCEASGLEVPTWKDHVDLYTVLRKRHAGLQIGGSLAKMLEHYGIESKGDSWTCVQPAFESGDWDRLQRYCIIDCIRTQELYEKTA